MRDRVDRDDDTHILAVDVERGANRHWVDRVVLALDQFRLVHDAVDGDMETVVVLRREAENAQCAADEPLRIFRIRSAQEPLDGELAALDPYLLRHLHRVEDDGTAVCRGGDDLRVIWRRTRSRGRLQGAVEEFVEALELIRGEKDLRHVELVKLNKGRDLGGGGRVVELFALLNAERFQ